MNLSSDQIKKISTSGKILARTLNEICSLVKPGISAQFIEEKAVEMLGKQNARPSFKGYHVYGIGRYPYATCISVNDEIVHGFPVKEKVFKDGDIVSIDLGADYQGLYSDAAVTVGVGNITNEAKRLISVTEASLYLGIDQAKRGNHIGDIGHAIETYCEANGFGVVRDLVGHGIGTEPHMDPQIPNFGPAGTGEQILNGMALAIEPMITAGDYHTVAGFDGWTILTEDGSLAAHFEHTVVIIDGEPVIVTQ